MTTLLKVYGIYKVVDQDFEGKTILVEAFRQLTPSEKDLEEFSNQRCKICGCLRGDHNITCGNSPHPFSEG